MKKHYKNEANAIKDAEKENCDIVCGSNGWTDIYYLVPRNAERQKIYRLIQRSQGDLNGKQFMFRVIYVDADGTPLVIEAASKYRVSRVMNGDIPDDKVYDYLNGYYTLAEERSEKIRQRKENARISHFLCDAAGAEGHTMRQMIRQELRKKQR